MADDSSSKPAKLAKLNPTVWRWSYPPDINETNPISHVTKVAMFDLDDTLVVANHRPKSSSDYTFMPHIKEHLTELIELGVAIVVVTNQGGIAHGNSKIVPRVATIMQNIASFLHLDDTSPSAKSGILQCYIAGAHDIYRKPMTGLFERYIWPTFPKAKSWSFVGDAAGRPGDFSSTDRKFAYNVDLIFQYLRTRAPTTDESLKNLVQTIYPNGQPLNVSPDERPRLSFRVPEECFAEGQPNQDTRPREWWGFYPGGYLKQLDSKAAQHDLNAQLAKVVKEAAKGISVIVMIGAQGSGKTSTALIIAEKIKGTLVSRDNYATQAKFIEQAQKLVKAGRSIVLDATHPTRVSRGAVVVAVMNAVKGCNLIYVHVNTPRNLAFHLNQVRLWKAGNYVPEVAHHKFYNEFQAPDECIEIPFHPEFRSPDDRFRFLQFTEEGAQHRVSTQED